MSTQKPETAPNHAVICSEFQKAIRPFLAMQKVVDQVRQIGDLENGAFEAKRRLEEARKQEQASLEARDKAKAEADGIQVRLRELHEDMKVKAQEAQAARDKIVGAAEKQARELRAAAAAKVKEAEEISARKANELAKLEAQILDAKKRLDVVQKQIDTAKRAAIERISSG